MPQPSCDPLLAHLREQTSDMVALLKRFVESESPSTDKAAVDHLGKLVAKELRDTGGRVAIHPSRTTGSHIEAEFFAPSRTGSRRTRQAILLLGHLDTVWGLGALSEMPFRITGGRAYGPGIFDMKAGVVLGLFALRSIRALGLSMPAPVTFLLNADEEIGSPSSRPLTEKLARNAAAALVLEPALGPGGALKTARRGVGEYVLRVDGRAAHAGLDPRKGASAITELAHQLTIIQSFTDFSRGVTLNPGVVRGGSRGNVIAAQAEAVIDLRVRRLADAVRLEKRLRALRPHDRRTRLQISGGINRPPFERTAAVAGLFTLARKLARTIGIKLSEAEVGGGSDGNFTAALGVPTLDGLGAVGDGAHAADEQIIVSELPRRAALLAHLLVALANR